MRHLRRALAVSAAGVAAAASLHQPASTRPAAPATIALASSARTALLPTTVLVHGLDSSKETFCSTMGRLAAANFPCIALDLRGHGESPLGDVDDFSAPALAADVLAGIRAHGIERAVLFGHSMGGRIAMRAAALDAASGEPLLRAVVIEDMDTHEFSPPAAHVADSAALARFASSDGRRFPSWEKARAALLPWYDGDEGRVDSWRNKRVRPLLRAGAGGEEVWSDINPAAQRLARERVLASSDGSEAWAELATYDRLPFALHVFYADELDRPGGTVVRVQGEGGIDEMRSRLPAAEFTFFAGAGHSIHGTQPTEFDEKLRAIIVAATA